MTLTQKIIDDLFGIYKEEFGPVALEHSPSIESVNYFLKTGCFEYCAGSKWAVRSKFILSKFITKSNGVSFYINADAGTYNEREVKKAEESFNNRVKQYIASLN